MNPSEKTYQDYKELFGLSSPEIHGEGAIRWARRVMDDLETGMHEQPCAVGFKMMGQSVDMFSNAETEELLADRSITKIVLRRKNITAEWVSKQTACFFEDYAGLPTSSGHP